MNILFNSCKSILKKWLLLATMLLGMITFSGYSSSVSSVQLKPVQTELVIHTNIARGIATYKKTLDQIKVCASSISLYKNRASKLFSYNKLVKAKLKASAKQKCLCKLRQHYLPQKTISPNTDGDILETIAG
jgi:hypothetical protein